MKSHTPWVLTGAAVVAVGGFPAGFFLGRHAVLAVVAVVKVFAVAVVVAVVRVVAAE